MIFRKYIYHLIFSLLVGSFIFYTIIVYVLGTANYAVKSTEKALKGQMVWQQYNCQSCHQIYGLGGYMGPDLTNITSDQRKGVAYAGLFIRTGSARMPKFTLNDEEIDQLIAFLKQVDESGKSLVKPESIDFLGNYSLAQNEHD